MRCYMHNASEAPPASYQMLLPIGNVIPLCTECCAWWRMDAARRPEDVMVQPVAIWDVPREMAGPGRR